MKKNFKKPSLLACLFSLCLSPMLCSSNLEPPSPNGSWNDIEIGPIYKGHDIIFTFVFTAHYRGIYNLRVAFHSELSPQGQNYYPTTIQNMNAPHPGVNQRGWAMIPDYLVGETNYLILISSYDDYEQQHVYKLLASPLTPDAGYDLLTKEYQGEIQGPISYQIESSQLREKNLVFKSAFIAKEYAPYRGVALPLPTIHFAIFDKVSHLSVSSLSSNEGVLAIKGENYEDFLKFGFRKSSLEEAILLPLTFINDSQGAYFHPVLGEGVASINLYSGLMKAGAPSSKKEKGLANLYLPPREKNITKTYEFELRAQFFGEFQKLHFAFKMDNVDSYFGNCLSSSWCVGMN